MHGYGHSDPDVVAGGRGHGHRARRGMRGCVPPENPAAMAAAIERLAGSAVDRPRLGGAARAAPRLSSRDAPAASVLGVLAALSRRAGWEPGTVLSCST